MNEFEFERQEGSGEPVAPQNAQPTATPPAEPVPGSNYIPYRPQTPLYQEPVREQAPPAYGMSWTPVTPPVQEASYEQEAPQQAQDAEYAPFYGTQEPQGAPIYRAGDPRPIYGYPVTEEAPPESNYGYAGQGYIPGAPVKKEKKKAQPRFTGKALLVFAICFSIIGSLLGGCFVVLLQRHYAQEDAQAEVNYLLEGRREQVELESILIDTDTLMTPAEVYAANVNSTVGITTTSTTSIFWGYQTTSAASGSGFIISDSGHILTNFHVIEGSDSISVAMYNGETYDAQLLGYDESNDIAVLKIDAGVTTPVILGDSDKVNVGDTVVAIGNPLGELTFSLTSGSVSAKDREITLSGSISMNLIQTDCAINSGNSGGALFNLYGEVIGVTNAKYSGSSSSSATIDNIGFAIPLNSIREIVRGIIEDGYILKSYAGVSVADLGFEAQWYGLPYGAYVQDIDPNGPAATVLAVGDIITAVDGKSISSGEQFIRLVEGTEVGQTMVLSVYRQGQTIQLSLVVGQCKRAALPNGTRGMYY